MGRPFSQVAVRAALVMLAVFFALPPLAGQILDESLLKDMQWRLIGPFRGGRVLAVAGIPGNPYTYYFGAVAGGVWKSTNAGNDWTPIFDKEPVSSIGAIAIAPSDPNVLYVGTGESCIRGNISFGDGVYKSLDGGKTWANIGLRDSRHIGKIVIDPHNSDLVFVAALGHAYGPNPVRGVFRSTDGGKTWEKVLFKDDKTGAIDLAMDPTNSHIIFAALWEAYRTPYSLVSGGPGSGLYKSSDGGTTWKRLEGSGLPKGVLGRIGVSVSGADPNRVYALIEAEEGGLFRSDDGGERWARVNEDHRLRQRAWYFTHIFADPQNTDTVYVLNTGLFRSTDGGKTLALLAAPHGDHHGLWIDPTNPRRMINSNDGGVTITVDGGATWTRQDNQPTAQFYHVAIDNRVPYYVYGAQQDNSTVGIASWSDNGVIDRPDWYSVGGGESGYIAPDPSDPNIVYAGSYAGYLSRFDRRSNQDQDITPFPENDSGYGAAGLKHRFQWTSPVLISPHDPKVLYAAGEFLFKSENRGMSWTVISPDLTRNDKSKQASSGGPITKDNTSVEYYDTIFAVAESPLEKGLIWVGSDDGLVHLTRNGGDTWSDITPKDMPEWSMISIIEPSPNERGTAYLAVDRHKLDDSRPYIYKTEDFGKTWTRINDGIPDTTYVHAVREDPVRKGLLFAGTETGIYFSLDGGGHWQSLQLNLPTCPVHDLMVKGDDLVVATHGRAFWILDDISPLRQIRPETGAEEVYLYQPRPAYRLHLPEEISRRGPVGANPPPGAIVYYQLKSAPKGEITMEISDSQGHLIRKYSNRKKEEAAEEPVEWPDLQKPSDLLPAGPGLNRFAWDLRYEGPTIVPGSVFEDFHPKGPMVVPGSYKIRLKAGGQTYETSVEVRPDPRAHETAEDAQAQLDTGLKIRDAVSSAHGAVNQIRGLRAEFQGLKKRLVSDPNAKAVLEAMDALDKKMTPIEQELIQMKSKSSEDNLNYPVELNEQLVSLLGSVDGADTRPTEQILEEFNELNGRLGSELAAWKKVVQEDVAALNELMRKRDVPLISVPAASKD